MIRVLGFRKTHAATGLEDKRSEDGEYEDDERAKARVLVFKHLLPDWTVLLHGWNYTSHCFRLSMTR